MKNKHAFSYLLLLGIGIIWGSQFMLIDVSNRSMSPTTVATGRVFFAAVTMLILVWFFDRKPAKARPQSISAFSLWGRYALIALFEAVIPFATLAWGQRTVDSSIAAVCLGTIPIFVGLFVAVFVKSERHSVGSVLSIIVGFIGLLILLSPSLLQANVSHLMAEGAILISAISFAIAILIIKSMPPISGVRMTRNVFLIALIPMLIYFFATTPLSVFEQISWQSWLANMALGAFCSGFVYVLYVELIKIAGANFTALSNYLVPLFGTLLGVLVMGDTLHWTMVVSLIVILGSLVINKLPLFNR